MASVLMVKVKMSRRNSDPCVFFCLTRSVRMSTHVDDPIACGPSGAVDQVLTEISHFVLMRKGPKFNRREPVLYLGREYLEIENGYKVRHPEKYINSVLATLGMDKCNKVATPSGAEVDNASKEDGAINFFKSTATTPEVFGGKC